MSFSVMYQTLKPSKFLLDPNHGGGSHQYQEMKFCGVGVERVERIRWTRNRREGEREENQRSIDQSKQPV